MRKQILSIILAVSPFLIAASTPDPDKSFAMKQKQRISLQFWKEPLGLGKILKESPRFQQEFVLSEPENSKISVEGTVILQSFQFFKKTAFGRMGVELPAQPNWIEANLTLSCLTERGEISEHHILSQFGNASYLSEKELSENMIPDFVSAIRDFSSENSCMDR
jgi:hypothetical protein